MTLPPLLPPVAESIPAALKASPRWAPWRAQWSERRGKWDKIPAAGLSTRHPERWAPFAAAWQALSPDLAGIGYCMTGPHGVIGIDLDNCLDAPWALEVIGQLASYTELSPSGRGYRIFGLGSTDRDWTNHDVGIEVYAGHEARFLTVTGRLIDNVSTDLQPIAAGVLEALEVRYARERAPDDAISLEMPDLVDDLLLPSLQGLGLHESTLAFLTTGAHDGDASRALFAAGVALYKVGLTDAIVLSLLAANEHAMGVALEHRRQDPDRALSYLWREHCVKARGKAGDAVASPEEFSVVAAPKRANGAAAPPLPPFKRDKSGKIEAIVENVTLAVQRADYCGMSIQYDEFRDEIMHAARPGEWQQFADHHYVELRITLERHGFKPIGRELMRDVVGLVAQRNPFDSARLWLTGLPWDGGSRVDSFLSTRFGAEDSPYVRAVSRYMWTALAGRVLQPGVKADMVPILMGVQGAAKSTGIAAMAPGMEYFTEINFSTKDDDQARLMRGKLIGEIGELRGLHTRDLESINAFVTRTHENWIPKFREFSTQYPRRLVFVGTTNQDEFLADQTGHRRWLPVAVQRVDVKGIQTDRNQLWAEARMRFELFGVEFQVAEKLAPTVHRDHTIGEIWSGPIARWLDEPDALTGEIPRTREFLQVIDVAREALRIEDKQLGKREEMRIAASLRECNFLRVKRRINDVPKWVWVPKT